jgi:hypothetical protein
LWLGSGCQSEGGCPEAGSPCGGDPSGSWNVTGACRDPVFAPPVPVTYFQQPVQMARQPTPAKASSDWCSSLILGNVMGANGATSFRFPHDTLSVVGGQVTYTGEDAQQQQGTYQAVITTTGTGGIDLSSSCLTRMGFSLSCDMFAEALTSFAARKPVDPGVPCSDSPDEPASCQFFFSYQNISCAPISDGGCRCTYGVSFSGSFQGRWIRTGGLLTHSDTSRMLPTQADYCVQPAAGSLTLWGHDRTSIFQQAGIRTLNLVKAP